MGIKIRKQIYLEANQEVVIKRLASEMGVTEAEIIRQAIDQQAQRFRLPRRNVKAWEAELNFITRLIQQGLTPGERTWRREDLYER